MKSWLTDVIVVCVPVVFLVHPEILNLKNLLAARVLFPKCSPQNYLQFFYIISEKTESACLYVV